MSRGIELSKYDYDLENDSAFFYGTGKKYKKSMDLDGIILDMSEDDYVMAIEILDASKKFNVSKNDLLNLKSFDANIDVNKETIKVVMKINIIKRNNPISKCMEAVGLNSMNLPISNQGIALCS
ncbi:DUF2283 domain-containing protein [Methanosarcina barkeri]|uniref:DUF2283 domain-containing protein n=1 Tax=Methanosarcina barkeri TaxID=2208 RepID=UPI00064E38F5|nr:DUF2283 domain-containing protein [Methanosarcina barkeri]